MIGNKIKEKRIKLGYTQEQLAEVFNVSPQAISRWENGITSPDLSVIPSIAFFFSTSTDDLLGMNELRDTKELTTIHNLVHKCILNDDTDKAIKALRDGLKKYPADYGLLCELALCLSMYQNYKVSNENLNEALKISNLILQNCNNDKIRHTTMGNMSFILKSLGKSNEALKLGGKLPHIWESREVLLPYLSYEENEAMIKRNFKWIIELMYDRVINKGESISNIFILGVQVSDVPIEEKVNKILEYLS